MPYPATLEDIFGAFVNQGTLEEAALCMAEVAEEDPVFAKEIVTCLITGAEQGTGGDKSVVIAVNRSGYRVSSPIEAAQYCLKLLELFQGKINAAP
ncbi:MAG: hypothetical protein KME20_12895 [Kaiparowitsia implicata GSE-PSE-MK54-09C]|jgi:hypothetical protein|nr:hypothetical protein [Kaiparowitsia implicata GSE-PSE-MK54-09C]